MAKLHLIVVLLLVFSYTTFAGRIPPNRQSVIIDNEILIKIQKLNELFMEHQATSDELYKVKITPTFSKDGRTKNQITDLLLEHLLKIASQMDPIYEFLEHQTKNNPEKESIIMTTALQNYKEKVKPSYDYKKTQLMLREKYEYNFIKPVVKFAQRFKRFSELPTSSQSGYKLRNKRGLYLNPPTWKDLEQYGLPPFETTYDPSWGKWNGLTPYEVAKIKEEKYLQEFNKPENTWKPKYGTPDEIKAASDLIARIKKGQTLDRWGEYSKKVSAQRDEFWAKLMKESPYLGNCAGYEKRESVYLNDVCPDIINGMK